MNKKGLLGAIAAGVLVGGLMIAPELLASEDTGDKKPRKAVERIDKAFTEKKEQEVLHAEEVFGASYLTHRVDIESKKEWQVDAEDAFRPEVPHLHYSIKPHEPKTKIHVYDKKGNLIGYEFFNEHRETSDQMFVAVVQLRPGQYMTATKPIKVLPMIPKEEHLEEVAEADKKALFESMETHKANLTQKIEEGKASQATDEYIEFYERELQRLNDKFERIQQLKPLDE